MKKKLLRILRKDAVFRKRIRLSSGKISTFYCDARRVSLSSAGIFLISQLVWDAIKKDRVTAIGGPTLGADPIVAGVCFLSHQKKKKLKGFLIRKKPKGHGRQNLIEGKELEAAERVVVVDDVATSGASLAKAIEALRRNKVNVVRVVVVVDREEGARKTIESLGCQFTPLFTKGDIA